MNEISVIMSVYNTKEEWLRKSIESILNQTFKNFEFIIILDAPTDNSEHVVREYAKIDDRIIVIKNKRNIGLTKSLNIGIKQSKGKYIARMDSDDISNINRFETQVKYLENNNDIAVVGTYITTFDEKNNHSIGMNNVSKNKEINIVRMIFCNAGVAHSTAMIRKDFLLEKNIYYNENIKKAQDYALWTDIVLKGGKIDVINEILLEYRIHSEQITKQYSKEQIECIKKIMKKQINNYFDFEATDKELDINYNLYKNCNLIDKNETEEYLNKIFIANKKIRKIDENLLKREIYSIWLYDLISRVLKYRDFSLLFSKTTLKSFRWNYIIYTFKKRILDRRYKKMVMDYWKKCK